MTKNEMKREKESKLICDIDRLVLMHTVHSKYSWNESKKSEIKERKRERVQSSSICKESSLTTENHKNERHSCVCG